MRIQRIFEEVYVQRNVNKVNAQRALSSFFTFFNLCSVIPIKEESYKELQG